MGETGLPAERLREFLRELRPKGRAMLMREMERAAARGEQLPAAGVILEELRRLGDETSKTFLDQFNPYILDGLALPKVQGRMARSSVEAIWAWIARDVVPDAARAFERDAAGLLARGDKAAFERVLEEFQQQVVAGLERVFAEARDNERAMRRLSGHIATAGAVEDLGDFLAILKARAALAQVGARLPMKIKNLADEQLEHVKSVMTTAPAKDPGVFAYALVLLLSRLVQPWQLIRLAVKAAETDVAARVAASPYGRAVAIVLADIERAVTALRDDFMRADTASAIARMKEIHDALRAVRTELDLSGDTPWARQLAAIRAAVSQLLRGEVEQLPGHVRRLLRVRPANQTGPAPALDETDVADTEARLELLGACRNFANELAMNEATLRIFTDLQNYVETNATPLVDRLRKANGGERAYCKSQVDALVRFCVKLFGANYANLLAKAAEVASNSERRAAKA